jgi:hypothetical protein
MAVEASGMFWKILECSGAEATSSVWPRKLPEDSTRVEGGFNGSGGRRHVADRHSDSSRDTESIALFRVVEVLHHIVQRHEKLVIGW